MDISKLTPAHDRLFLTFSDRHTKLLDFSEAHSIGRPPVDELVDTMVNYISDAPDPIFDTPPFLNTWNHKLYELLFSAPHFLSYSKGLDLYNCVPMPDHLSARDFQNTIIKHLFGSILDHSDSISTMGSEIDADERDARAFIDSRATSDRYSCYVAYDGEHITIASGYMLHCLKMGQIPVSLVAQAYDIDDTIIHFMMLGSLHHAAKGPRRSPPRNPLL